MTVEHYEMGTFTTIESPITFPEGKVAYDAWEKHYAKAGYSKTDAFGLDGSPDIVVYHQSNLEADCDYPYFVIVDLCGEGRHVFMKNIWNVTHFINNHGAFAAYNLLTFMHENLLESRRCLENS